MTPEEKRKQELECLLYEKVQAQTIIDLIDKDGLAIYTKGYRTVTSVEWLLSDEQRSAVEEMIKGFLQQLIDDVNIEVADEG